MGKKTRAESMADAPEAVETTATETFDDIEIGSDAEFMDPPADLRKKVKQRAAKAGDPDPVAAAEAALARMASSFDDWMSAETQRLSELWTAADLTDYEREAREAFYRAAHDIKGQAATMGFPVAGRIAGSLCRLLEAIEEPEQLPRELVRQHVQSVRAIIVENAREDTSKTARLLAQRLDEVTEDFLDHMSRAA
mgnify:CR=1 FL=1